MSGAPNPIYKLSLRCLFSKQPLTVKRLLQIPKLHSISNLRPEDVIPTNGSTPVVVLCDDLEYWVVKYPRRNRDFDLAKEYLGAAFLREWGLAIPEFAFVKVPMAHVPMGLHPRIQPYFFKGTCFGLKYERHFDEVTKLLEGMSDYQKNLIVRKEEFFGNCPVRFVAWKRGQE